MLSKFHVPTTMVVNISVFWVIKPYRRSQGSLLSASCWFLVWLIIWPWNWRRYFTPKRQLIFNGAYGVISQNVLLIFLCLSSCRPNSSIIAGRIFMKFDTDKFQFSLNFGSNNTDLHAFVRTSRSQLQRTSLSFYWRENCLEQKLLRELKNIFYIECTFPVELAGFEKIKEISMNAS
jgi:hypothetical protein